VEGDFWFNKFLPTLSDFKDKSRRLIQTTKQTILKTSLLLSKVWVYLFPL